MTWLWPVRALAVGVAVAAVIDPGIRRDRTAPLSVSLRSPDGTLIASGGPDPLHTRAGQVRATLEAAFTQGLAINTPAEPRAVVIVGQTLAPSLIPDTAAVSFIVPEVARGAHVRVMSVRTPK